MSKKKNDLNKVIGDDEMRQRITTSPDFKFVYANHSRIATSFYDIRFFLGQSSITAKGEVTVTEEQCVVMSPEGAKAFIENAVRTLMQYEQGFGKVKTLSAPALPTEAKQIKN